MEGGLPGAIRYVSADGCELRPEHCYEHPEYGLWCHGHPRGYETELGPLHGNDEGCRADFRNLSREERDEWGWEIAFEVDDGIE